MNSRISRDKVPKPRHVSPDCITMNSRISLVKVRGPGLDTFSAQCPTATSPSETVHDAVRCMWWPQSDVPNGVWTCREREREREREGARERDRERERER